MAQPKMIFVHGGPGFTDYLEPYFRDLPGAHFYNQARGPHVSMDELITQLATQVGATPAVLVGHSWGGVLATEFAVRHPELVSSLVLICTALSHRQWLAYRQTLAEMGLADAPLDEIMLVSADGPGAKAFFDGVGETFSPETFDSLDQSYLGGFDLTHALAELPIHIVNIYGEKDLRFPIHIGREIGSLNPQIENLCLKGAGHFPFLQSQALATIQSVLRSLTPDVARVV